MEKDDIFDDLHKHERVKYIFSDQFLNDNSIEQSIKSEILNLPTMKPIDE